MGIATRIPLRKLCVSTFIVFNQELFQGYVSLVKWSIGDGIAGTPLLNVPAHGWAGVLKCVIVADCLASGGRNLRHM